MISAWTKHIPDPEEKKRFHNAVLGSKTVLNRLQALLDEEKVTLETAEISPKIYELPNWDYKQAHTNGFKAALKMVSKIINLDQENK